MQLSTGRGPRGCELRSSGHIDSKLAGLEQKLQGTPSTKEVSTQLEWSRQWGWSPGAERAGLGETRGEGSGRMMAFTVGLSGLGYSSKEAFDTEAQAEFTEGKRQVGELPKEAAEGGRGQGQRGLAGNS